MSDDDEFKPVIASHDDAFRRFQRARTPEGGIKAQSKRGKMAQTWWAGRWLAVLESFQIGARLDRGKSYARKGQVTKIDIEKGVVRSTVQGSRREPYDVAIKVNQLTHGEWVRMAQVFAGKAIFAAKLLSGQMPQEIESAFREANLTLFPAKEADLQTDCTCPDWSNPCKHIAAVYYLLGEEFDRDPFLVFRLRGITRDELLDLLDEQISGAKTKSKAKVVALPTVSPASQSDPIPSDHERFWKAGAIPSDLVGSLHSPEANAVMARRLGPFPFWRGESDFWQTLDRIYRLSSAEALRSFESSGENTKRSKRSD